MKSLSLIRSAQEFSNLPRAWLFGRAYSAHHTDSSYVLLDFSSSMHELARIRLDSLTSRAEFVERSFKEAGWESGLGKFHCIVTNQGVHELRNKRYALALHLQARAPLEAGGVYLVCDHFVGKVV